MKYPNIQIPKNVWVKHEDKKVKRWIALFICMAIRAIHLETVNSLSAENFLLALRKLMAILSKTRTMLPDNAKNFSLSQEAIKKIQTDIVEEEIEGNFIPKYAPWEVVYE